MLLCRATAQILEGRTERRQIGSRAGNTFSVATFALDDAPGGGGAGDGLPPRRRGRGAAAAEDEAEKEYWRQLLPDAVANHENKVRVWPDAVMQSHTRKCLRAANSVATKMSVWKLQPQPCPSRRPAACCA